MTEPKHLIEDLSYAEGWSRCSCGQAFEADASIEYLVERDQDLAQRMTAHIAVANGKRPWVVEPA